MNAEQLHDEYADYFMEKGDGLPSDLEHYMILGSDNKSFTLIFPTGCEDETGDITLHPFNLIFGQIKNFREYIAWNGDEVNIKVNITTPEKFQWSSNCDEEELASILEVGDSSWKHDFYVFITFSN